MMPSSAGARRAVVQRALELDVDSSIVTALELAVGELVANAHQHGEPPVTVTVEATAHGFSAEVADRGAGPVRAVQASVMPSPLATSGRGRWLVHTTGLVVEELWGSDGYRIRLHSHRR